MSSHLLWIAAPLIVVVLCLLTVAPATRAEFPEPAQLPSRPELPDPLTTLDGKPVTTKEQWLQQRRPELKTLFQHYMYGYFPAPVPVDAKVERVDAKALGGKATLKEITLSLGGPQVPKLHLLLVVPNHRTRPAPVFVGMNFNGNHAVLDDAKIQLPAALKGDRAEPARGRDIKTWSIEQTIDRGYAVATLWYGDVVPDNAKARSEGIQPHFGKSGNEPGPNDWGAIAAWAWGLQRVVDYLQTDRDIDVARVIVMGHSRLGKTALLAGAFDDRIAVVIPHQAGCGGTAPSRTKNKAAESVKRINTSFPHWFNGAFKQFNDEPDRLPFDQHCLIALCAPRPVLLSNAVEDQWANPGGQFEMLQAADPVYRLLGVEGLEAKALPPEGKLVDSRLGYYIRAGKHSTTPEDWRVFADFADRHLGKPEISEKR
jgi:hypothetical protein